MRNAIILILLGLFSAQVSANISKQQTQQIFNQLIRSNGIKAKLGFSPNSSVNAEGGQGQVIIYEGMLKYADRDVMIAVLAHELAHATGHVSEMEADIYSGRIGSNAGLNVCPGAKKFLLTLGLESGDGIHLRGDARLKAMCKRI